MKPITPQEVNAKIAESFPEFVIEAVNNCILKESFGKKSFSINQDVIVKEILKLAPKGTKEEMVFDKHWLDFEKVYEKFGWNVTYDSPSWGDSYDEHFQFEVK